MFGKKTLAVAMALVIASMALSACGNAAPATPTIDPNALITEVALTVQAGITQTAAAMPTSTPTVEPTATQSPTATVTATLATPGGVPTVTRSAVGPGTTGSGTTTGPDNASFVADVTISDGTLVVQNTTFTKTWRIRNTGTTTWTTGYKLVYYDGQIMSDKMEIVLPKSVAPGSEIEISVPMKAPNSIGNYKSWWRMVSESGQFFGDPLYVYIATWDGVSTPVGAAPTATTNTTVVPSLTPTP